MDDDGERALQEVSVVVLGSDGDLRGANGVAVVRWWLRADYNGGFLARVVGKVRDSPKDQGSVHPGVLYVYLYV